jgi:hypothetical protein
LHARRAGAEVPGLLVAGIDRGGRVPELVDDDETSIGFVREDDLVDRPGRVAQSG